MVIQTTTEDSGGTLRTTQEKEEVLAGSRGIADYGNKDPEEMWAEAEEDLQFRPGKKTNAIDKIHLEHEHDEALELCKNLERYNMSKTNRNKLLLKTKSEEDEDNGIGNVANGDELKEVIMNHVKSEDYNNCFGIVTSYLPPKKIKVDREESVNNQEDVDGMSKKTSRSHTDRTNLPSDPIKNPQTSSEAAISAKQSSLTNYLPKTHSESSIQPEVKSGKGFNQENIQLDNCSVMDNQLALPETPFNSPFGNHQQQESSTGRTENNANYSLSKNLEDLNIIDLPVDLSKTPIKSSFCKYQQQESCAGSTENNANCSSNEDQVDLNSNPNIKNTESDSNRAARSPKDATNKRSAGSPKEATTNRSTAGPAEAIPYRSTECPEVAINYRSTDMPEEPTISTSTKGPEEATNNRSTDVPEEPTISRSTASLEVATTNRSTGSPEVATTNWSTGGPEVATTIRSTEGPEVASNYRSTEGLKMTSNNRSRYPGKTSNSSSITNLTMPDTISSTISPEVATNYKSTEGPEDATTCRSTDSPEEVIPNRFTEGPKEVTTYRSTESPEVATTNRSTEGPEMAMNNKSTECLAVTTNNWSTEGPKVTTNYKLAKGPEVTSNNWSTEGSGMASSNRSTDAHEVATNNSSTKGPEVATNNSSRYPGETLNSSQTINLTMFDNNSSTDSPEVVTNYRSSEGPDEATTNRTTDDPGVATYIRSTEGLEVNTNNWSADSPEIATTNRSTEGPEEATNNRSRNPERTSNNRLTESPKNASNKSSARSPLDAPKDRLAGGKLWISFVILYLSFFGVCGASSNNKTCECTFVVMVKEKFGFLDLNVQYRNCGNGTERWDKGTEQLFLAGVKGKNVGSEYELLKDGNESSTLRIELKSNSSAEMFKRHYKFNKGYCDVAIQPSKMIVLANYNWDFMCNGRETMLEFMTTVKHQNESISLDAQLRQVDLEDFSLSLHHDILATWWNGIMYESNVTFNGSCDIQKIGLQLNIEVDKKQSFTVPLKTNASNCQAKEMIKPSESNHTNVVVGVVVCAVLFIAVGLLIWCLRKRALCFKGLKGKRLCCIDPCKDEKKDVEKKGAQEEELQQLQNNP